MSFCHDAEREDNDNHEKAYKKAIKEIDKDINQGLYHEAKVKMMRLKFKMDFWGYEDD